MSAFASRENILNAYQIALGKIIVFIVMDSDVDFVNKNIIGREVVAAGFSLH